MARLSKEKMKEIRSRIVEVASKKFLMEGYDKTSTKALAKEVGIAEGTLFNYFQTKAELYLEVLVNRLDLNEASITYDLQGQLQVHEKIGDYVKQLYGPMLRLPKFMLQEVMQVLLNIGLKNYKYIERLAKYDIKYIEMTRDYIGELMDQGYIRKGTDPQLLAETIYGAVLFEFSMYMYKKEMTIKEMDQNILDKLAYICQGHLSSHSEDA